MGEVNQEFNFNGDGIALYCSEGANVKGLSTSYCVSFVARRCAVPSVAFMMPLPLKQWGKRCQLCTVPFCRKAEKLLPLTY